MFTCIINQFTIDKLLDFYTYSTVTATAFTYLKKAKNVHCKKPWLLYIVHTSTWLNYIYIIAFNILDQHDKKTFRKLFIAIRYPIAKITLYYLMGDTRTGTNFPDMSLKNAEMGLLIMDHWFWQNFIILMWGVKFERAMKIQDLFIKTVFRNIEQFFAFLIVKFSKSMHCPF